MKMASIKEKLTDVDDLLVRIGEENRLDENEILYIREIIEEQSTIIDVLTDENVRMKEKLPLHDEILNYKQDASDMISSLNSKLGEMRLKVLELEKKLTQVGINVVLAESSKIKELDDLNHQWEEKLRNADEQSKRVVEEIVKKHCEAKKGYETAIQGLKEQISHKEAEVAWCQLMMKERDNHIDKEIANLKKELEVTTMKNQELLQQRLVEVEKRANKMTRKCLKLQQDYEQKISYLKKEKELQVQALQTYVQNEAERDTCVKETKMEHAVKGLEMRYRKIIISLHTAAQQQRQRDLKRIATLESAVTNGKTETPA